jgi:predicted Zn-dependent protease
MALAKGDGPGAIAALSRATKLDPVAPRPRFVLARARLAAGDLGEAAFQLDRYVQLAPKDPNGYVERARVARQAGDRAGVIESLRRGEAAVPGFPWAQVRGRLESGALH